MKRQFQRGLVVGKFCPLHFGHESVINRALGLCEEVIIISYTNPEFPGCEPETRRSWLASRFPAVPALVVGAGDGIKIPPNDADERTHRRFVGGLCQELLGIRVDAVFTSETYGDGFARELTAFFRKRDPDFHPVQHVLVDLERGVWPVSGTQLRKHIHAHRQSLAPEVYASFVQRVALLGGESSGKSTLAAALAAMWNTEWVPEYGRELWEGRGGVLEPGDMPKIAQTQISREDAACLRARRFVFCDSTPMTTLFYSQAMFGVLDPRVVAAASRHYDTTILCVPDFPFVQDGTRRDSPFRKHQHEWYRDRLATGGVDFFLAKGSVQDRVAAVSRYLEVASRNGI